MTSLHDLITALPSLSARKLRLFAVACCRRVLDSPLLDVAERLAEGRVTEAEREEAETEAFVRHVEERERPASEWSREREFGSRAVLLCLADGPFQALDAATYVRQARRVPHGEAAPRDAEEEAAQRDLLREVFGPPARIAPAWRAANDHAAELLAAAIYEQGAWELTPILADALEEAGCGDGAVLGHLRGPGPHVRGCWAVDLILAKDR
ncbi:MAG: hypothetical protein ACRC33_08625 [Gemmataceae bacterium]